MDGLRKLTESDLKYWCQQVPLWELHEVSFLLNGNLPLHNDYDFIITNRNTPIGSTYFALRKCAIHEENNISIPGISFKLVSVDANTKKTGKEWIAIAKKYGFDIPQELLDAIEKYVCMPAESKVKPKEEKKDKPLKTIEKNKLLILVYGMAKAWYGYDPKKARSDSISEIINDLQLQGIKMDDETIRKYLRQGAEIAAETLDA